MSNPWDNSIEQNNVYKEKHYVFSDYQFNKASNDYYFKQKRIYQLSSNLSNLFISFETKQELSKFSSLLSNIEEEKLITIIKNLKFNICSMSAAIINNVFIKVPIIDTFVLPYEFIDMFIEIISDIFSIIKSLPSLLEINHINIKIISQRINNKFS